MSGRSGAKRAGDVLGELIEGLGLGTRLAGWRAVEEWDGIVGEEMASYSRALRFDRGRLVVEVAGSGWMARLAMEKPALLRKIGQRVGRDVVREIVLVMASRPRREEKT